MTISLVRLAGLLAAFSALLFSAAVVRAPRHPPTTSEPGPNVLVFDPSMTTAQIQAKVNDVRARQVDNEFSSERYALLFKPGTYGTPEQPLQFKVGYYTEVAGLGASPTDVTINGKIEVYNRCLADADEQLPRARQLLALALEPHAHVNCWGRTAAARARTSGPSRRRRRCGA
jgi:hypothetical protein